MSVRQIGKTWWTDFWFNHKRHRKRSPENTRTGALAYEALLRQKLARGEQLNDSPKAESETFEQFAWKWHEEYVVPNNKHLEQRMKAYILRAALIPFFGDMRLEQITSQHIEQFKARALKRGLKQKTVNNQLAVLGKCIRTAYEWRKIQGVPPKIALLKCPPAPINYLSADECSLLLSNAEGVTKDAILTALRTGMRQGEIRALQWASINWESQTIAVRHSLNDRTHELESPKSNRERHIPMDTDVYEMLFNRRKETGYVFLDEKGRPFDSKRFIQHLEYARNRAGLRKFTWHSLRHTFATQLAMRGAPLHAVQALLGHSTIATTMRYAHVAPSTLRSVIDLLSPKEALNAGLGQRVVNQPNEPHSTLS